MGQIIKLKDILGEEKSPEVIFTTLKIIQERVQK